MGPPLADSSGAMGLRRDHGVLPGSARADHDDLRVRVYAQNQVFSSENNPLAAVVTGLTLYAGAVVAELVRSGRPLAAEGSGGEAGLSIDLTPGQTLRSVQLPQALTAMLPALIGHLVVVLKDSAGYQITYLELLLWSKTLGSAYANTVPAYIVAAVLFIIANYTLTVLARYVERRLSHRGKTSVPAVAVAATGDDLSAAAA